MDIMNIITKRLNTIHISDKQEIKSKIKHIFDIKLRNKKFNINKIDTDQCNQCGSEGSYIESLFTKNSDNNNHADFCGYEIKKSANKISFGDWSADEYIFNQKDYLSEVNKNINSIDKNKFLQLFGAYNYKKNRNSWSGKVCPRYYQIWTNSGQIITSDKKNNIYIVYSYSKDKRNEIHKIMPDDIKSKEFIILAFWSIDSIETKVSRKFNNLGTIIVNKNKENIYDKLLFCNKITPRLFIDKFKEKIIFFDSGMHENNSRNYSQFRANKQFWISIVDEEY